MKNSQSSPYTLTEQLQQLPLPGMKMKLQSPKPNYEFHVENKGDGRYRLHATKKG
jgi:hypothetical protein